MTQKWTDNYSNVTIAGYPRSISDTTLAQWLGVTEERVRYARSRVKESTRKVGRPVRVDHSPISHGDHERYSTDRTSAAQGSRALLRGYIAYARKYHPASVLARTEV
jgi:hypothetical protein